jgi:hypothetical protein
MPSDTDLTPERYRQAGGLVDPSKNWEPQMNAATAKPVEVPNAIAPGITQLSGYSNRPPDTA